MCSAVQPKMVPNNPYGQDGDTLTPSTVFARSKSPTSVAPGLPPGWDAPQLPGSEQGQAATSGSDNQNDPYGSAGWNWDGQNWVDQWGNTRG